MYGQQIWVTVQKKRRRNYTIKRSCQIANGDFEKIEKYSAIYYLYTNA